jgi:outer membrane protein TolC
MALDRGYDARIARLEAARASDLHARSRDVFLPKLWLTSAAGYSNRYGEKLEVLDHQGQPRTYGLATLGLTEGWLNVFVEQVLVDLQRWREAERAELAAELARLREAERREAIANEVAQLFTRVLRLEELSAAGGDEERSALWLDEQAVALRAAGRALDSEREAVALHLEGLRLENAMRAGELSEARAGLWLAVSGSAEVSPDVALDAGSLPSFGPPASPEELEAALAASPGARALEIAREVEQKGVESARAGRLPTVGLRGGYSHYGIKRYDSYDDEVRVGVDVRVPIFDGFDARDAVAAAENSEGIARLQRESVLAARRVRVGELARRLAGSTARADLERRVADSARESTRIADLALRAGRGPLDACLAARERAGAARAAAIAARHERVEIWAELESELGRLAAAVGAP